MIDKQTASRLISLRRAIVNESISSDELLELQSLQEPVLELGDTLLMEWAGIPENIDERIKSAVSSQLWRYYGIEIDIDEITPLGSSEYFLTGSSEKYVIITYKVKFKLFENGKVEDLYLHDGDGYIEPTTTPEEQASR